uniref:Ribosome assembly factor mrt4 n=1 Tax=Zooxanthella nutricula TaxID=1333877 RepID=A0A7S2VFU6_9DINO
MPKSKRNVKVSLTKTKKRPRDKKDALIEEIRGCCEKFSRLYLLSVENERNTFLQVVRQKFRPGRLVCAKNKVMQVALGTTPAQECQDGVHQIAERIAGQCALLFTDQAPADVQSFLAEHRPIDFARAGCKATDTVVLPRGQDALAKLPHSIESHLRHLGMPTQLLEGKIHLLGDYTVCKAGQELTSDSAQILKLLELKQAQFSMSVEARWHKGGEFKDCQDLED